MGRTEFLTLTIRSEPRLESANQPRERNGALQQECMHSCAHTVIDTADIVRDGNLTSATILLFEMLPRSVEQPPPISIKNGRKRNQPRELCVSYSQSGMRNWESRFSLL